MKIYVASSWRNQYQKSVVSELRAARHEVYDFRNPKPGNHGFHWSEIDPEWKSWRPNLFVKALMHPIANSGFGNDWGAMQDAEACVLCLPCGRSAHLEAGYFVGAGKRLIILTNEVPQEPELMYKMADHIVHSLDTLVTLLR